jgi:hypothetical protein
MALDVIVPVIVEVASQTGGSLALRADISRSACTLADRYQQIYG